MLDILRKCETVPKKKLHLCINNTAGPSIISSKCVAYGTVASLCESKPYGIAYFTYNNTIIFTRFRFKELVIDGVLWATCLVKFIVHVGMQIFLEDFKHCGNKDYSYETRGSVFTKIADRGLQPIKYKYKPPLPKHLKGSICVVGRNSFNKSYPQIGVATIDDRNEIFFISENSVFVNEVSMQDYQHAFPSNYFKFGMPVLLANPRKCHYTKTVHCANGDTVRVSHVAHVLCVDENLCFVDLLRAGGKVNDAQTITEVFEDASTETGNNGANIFTVALSAVEPLEGIKAEGICVSASSSLAVQTISEVFEDASTEKGNEVTNKFTAALNMVETLKVEEAEDIHTSSSSLPVQTITDVFVDASTETGNNGANKLTASLSAVEPLEVEKAEGIRVSASLDLPVAILDNLKQETELKITPQVRVNNTIRPQVIHSLSKAYGTVASYNDSPCDYAYFTDNNTKITTLFKIQNLVIDDVLWHPAFAKYVVHIGMPIVLEDFQRSEKKNYLYVASGSIIARLRDCYPKWAPPPKSRCRKKQMNGEIRVVYRNGFDVAYPRLVVATVDGVEENVFIGENMILLNDVEFPEYRHICPRDYFTVGMPVTLANLQQCKQKTVKRANGDLFCKYVAQVVCFDKNLCFIRLLRVHSVGESQSTAANAFDDASAESGNDDARVKAAPSVLKLAKAEEAKAEEAKAGKAKAEEAKAEEAKAEEAKAEKAKAEEAKAEEAKAEEAKAEEAKASLSTTVSPPFALDNQKLKTDLNINPQQSTNPNVDVNNITRPFNISNSCVAYGKIAFSLDEYNLHGLAQFTFRNTMMSALYAINQLRIDDVSWHKAFAKHVVRVGMLIILYDFQYFEKDSSYVARGVVSVKSSECRRDVYRAPPTTLVPGASRMDGVISAVGKNGYNAAFPLIVVATIDSKTESVFVGDGSTRVNGVPLREYKHVFPADYFKVGMPVSLGATQRCREKTVRHADGSSTSCAVTSTVVCNDGKLCFVDLLQTYRNTTNT